jgi:predicted nucleic acid-binding protein
MIVVDSSVWIFALRGMERPSTIRLKQEAEKGRLVVGDVVLLEVLRGARDDRHAAFLEGNLRRFPVLPMMDDHLASAAAANLRALRKRGITIRNSIDLIIATFCIELGHILLQDDRDFEPMAEHLGLRLA